MVLPAKTKLNTIEVLISTAIINSNISHAEFVLVNDVLKKYNDIKKYINTTDIIKKRFI